MEPKYSHEDVNEMEKMLRSAQDTVEAVARKVCSSHNETAIKLWHDCTNLSEQIANAIYPLYKLRPIGE